MAGVEIKVGEPVNLRNGETVSLTRTVTLGPDGSPSERIGPAYVERDEVLMVYTDWQRPFVVPD